MSMNALAYLGMPAAVATTVVCSNTALEKKNTRRNKKQFLKN